MRINMNEEIICKHFKTCGNCQFLDKKYSETLKLKSDIVNKYFINNGFDIKIHSIIGTEKNLNYRNKMIISYQFQNGKLISGFYQERHGWKCVIGNVIKNICLQIKDFQVRL